MSDLLEIENLSVSFDTPQGELEAVREKIRIQQY